MLATQGDFLLGCGLLLMAVAAALCQFVMVGLIGLAIFPAAIALLLAAGLKARVPGLRPARLWPGAVLLVAGVVALVIASTSAGVISFRLLRTAHLPQIDQWVSLGIVTCAAALLIASALHFLTDWSGSRCLYWGVGVFGVVPATILLFRVCAIFLQLSA